ncbi:MAG: hypothetical protein HQ500_09100 [Flavobacteriales bacterium]|nr:hypothetical protein [Flavobacteriales bacterium]
MRFLVAFVFSFLVVPGFAQGRKLPPISFQEHSTGFADANRSYSNTGSYTQADTLSDEVILNSLAKIMELNPALVVQLTGHTALNEDPALGMQRAETVKQALVDRGVDAMRMQSENSAHNDPILSESVILSLPSKVERDVANQKNRRVEVSVVKTVVE